jgi:tetratricopeptide (TPR) repeat protein
MSIFSRLFRARDPEPEADLEARLRTLEEEFDADAPGAAGGPLNRAGDLALRHGQDERALDYYGRAVDSYLKDQQLEAARGVANKIIRVHPEAIRTLCTLTWLDLAARHMATALLHLRDYVEAAERGGQEALAAEQIWQMARIAPMAEFLASTADALDRLDRVDRADEVRSWVGPGGSPDAVHEPDELCRRCMWAATEVLTAADEPAGPTESGDAVPGSPAAGEGGANDRQRR